MELFIKMAKPKIILCYETTLEERWGIVKPLRAYFLASKDEQGQPIFQSGQYLFAFAQNPNELASILGGFEKRGYTADLTVMNLNGIDDDYKLFDNDYVRNARFLLFSRGLATSEHLQEFIKEKTRKNGKHISYSAGNRDDKLETAARWVERNLESVVSEDENDKANP